MPLGDYKQGQLNKLWQSILASPDRPSLSYGHGTTPFNVLMTGQNQVVTKKLLLFKIDTSRCIIFET